MKEIIGEQLRPHIPPKGINYWLDETDLVESVDGHRQRKNNPKNNPIREILIFASLSNPFPEED